MDGTILEKKLKLQEKLAQLNEIAQKVDDMPTFTSNDRAFLEELPGFPVTDGKKVLTATTESGETSLAYEEPEAGAVDYSTTEQTTGQKWINGKDIYFKTIDFGALPNNTTKSVSSGLTNEFIVKIDAFAYKSDAFYPLPFVSVTTLNDCIRIGYNIGNHTVDIVTSGDKSAISAYITLYYTKAEASRKTKKKTEDE